MFIVRPICADDLGALETLAAGADMTTLPAHRPSLKARIEGSIRAFNDNATPTRNYMMVAEDIDSGSVVGVAAIYVGIGRERPFWNFRQGHHTHVSRALDLRADRATLTLANDYVGATEIGSLFLSPRARGHGYGTLLARSRYLLMANALELFGDLAIAEVRGWVDDHGNSPFWNSVGGCFCPIDFAHADHLSGIGDDDFIGDLMPRFPIYVDMLPEPARRVIGIPHDKSRPAFNLLLREGFAPGAAVDIFDAGPVLEARTRDIAAVRDSRLATVCALVEDHSPGLAPMIGSSVAADQSYLCTLVRATTVDKAHVDLAATDARALNLAVGDTLRLLPVRRS